MRRHSARRSGPKGLGGLSQITRHLKEHPCSPATNDLRERAYAETVTP
jgi:hypothetical protein